MRTFQVKDDCRFNNTRGRMTNSGLGVLRDSQDWESQIGAIASRFNKEYRGEAFDLPDEVLEMPIYQERKAGLLQAKLTSPFWQLAKPLKNQRCLDIGCGVSFLIYPWREWDAVFYGAEVSTVARDVLNARGPQLNSKLFKGVQLAPAHELPYEAKQFDLAIATGVSCYYPLQYWELVLSEAKRVLKPGGAFVFDIVDAELATAENWAILETYLGTEIFLEPLSAWKTTIQKSGGKIAKTQPGEIFQLYKVTF
jgi:SAM-dependent methyltransferase